MPGVKLAEARNCLLQFGSQQAVLGLVVGDRIQAGDTVRIFDFGQRSSGVNLHTLRRVDHAINQRLPCVAGIVTHAAELVGCFHLNIWLAVLQCINQRSS